MTTNEDALQTFERARGVTLDEQQRHAVLTVRSTTDTSLFFVEALAGVGKSALLQAFVYSLVADYAKRPECRDNVVAVMVPTRELREDLLQELLGHPHIFPPESMLWLGRPPTSQPKGTTWDEVLAQELEKQEHPARELLAECKKNMQEALDTMANALLKCNVGPEWSYVTDYYTHDPPRPACAKIHVWLAWCRSAKCILAQHIRTEVEDIVKPYDERLKAAVAPVRVCLCTADAFAKLLAKVPAGPVSYAMMRFKKVEAACLDEAQSYEVDQAVACCKDLKTAIFMGDKNQTIVRTWPRWTRLPWESHDEVPATKALVPECEPLDDDDNAAAGPRPPRTTKNPEPRFITEWLTQASVCQLRLTGSKRYGAQVCIFLTAAPARVVLRIDSRRGRT